MNTYFKKSTKRSVISMLSIAITLCLLFSLLFPGKAVNATPRMRLNKTAITLIQEKTVKLRVIGTKKKVTWKSSNKKIAKVSLNTKKKILTIKVPQKATSGLSTTVRVIYICYIFRDKGMVSFFIINVQKMRNLRISLTPIYVHTRI